MILYVQTVYNVPGNLQFKMTNDDQQRLIPIHLLHFTHRSQNCQGGKIIQPL